MLSFRRCRDCESLPRWPHAEWCDAFVGPKAPRLIATWDATTKTSTMRLPVEWAYVAGTKYDPAPKIACEEAA